jgi:hypothetical protein
MEPRAHPHVTSVLVPDDLFTGNSLPRCEASIIKP